MKKYSATPGKGKTTSPAAAKYAYISRLGRYVRGTDSCVCTWSGNLPSFARGNPDIFWSAVDEYERSNGRRYRTLEIALPLELTESQREELARGYVAWVTQDSLPYTAAIHAGYGSNPHVHVIINERMEDGIERTAEEWVRRAAPVSKNPQEGGARKTQRLDKKIFLVEAREMWAKMANSALEKAGHDARIDHRTLEEQQGDPKPSPAQKAQRKTHKSWLQAKAAQIERDEDAVRESMNRIARLRVIQQQAEDFEHDVKLLTAYLADIAAGRPLSHDDITVDDLHEIYAELEEDAGLSPWEQSDEKTLEEDDEEGLRPGR